MRTGIFAFFKFLPPRIIIFFQKIFPIKSKKPNTLQLHTTTDCNLNCKYCYSKNDLPTPVNWDDLLKQAKKIGVRNIEFLGGEPLLDPNLFHYLKLCAQFKFNINIFTNGILLSENWITTLKKYPHHVILTVKYDTPEELDKTFGAGHYQIISSNINKAVGNNLIVRPHVLINSQNYSSINEFVRYANNLNCFFTIERYIIQHHETDTDYKLTSNQWNKALEDYHHYCRSKNASSLAISTLKGNGCSCYNDIISIRSNGNSFPCPFASEEQSLGNIMTISLKEIWRKYQILRDTVWRIPEGECRGCQHWVRCHGGCKTYVFKESHCYNHKDPLCNKSCPPFGVYISF